MKRVNNTIFDFLSDQDFINWVKNPTPDKDRYWQLWLETHPDCREAMLEARELILSMKFQLPTASHEEKLSILKNILKTEKPIKRQTLAQRVSTISPNLIKIAAAIILLITSAYLLVTFRQNSPVSPRPANMVTVKEVGKGARMQIRLPDGSRVWINSESRITYDTSFNHQLREVELYGEAYFEVARDSVRPFMVKSGNLITQALGTSFNIKAFLNETDIEVSLVTGKVGVTEISANPMTVVLEPGEKIVSSKGKGLLEKQYFNYEEGVGWKDGLLYFKNADFNEIQKRLERWYGISIHVNQADSSHFSQWNYTGKFENQSLEMVLKRMGFTKDFTFSIRNQEIYLHPKY